MPIYIADVRERQFRSRVFIVCVCVCVMRNARARARARARVEAARELFRERLRFGRRSAGEKRAKLLPEKPRLS